MKTTSDPFGAGDWRWFVTLSFAEELLVTPSLLAAYASAFGPGDDATLLIYSDDHDESQLRAALSELVRRSNLRQEDLPDVVGLADHDSIFGAVLRRGAHAALSLSRRPGFDDVPHFSGSEVPALRGLAEAEWAEPAAWLWRAEPLHEGVVNRSAPGDYYSPIPDTAELAREPRRSQIWPAIPPLPIGVDFREERQIALCTDVFARQERLAFAERSENPTEYVTTNDQYPPLDAWVLEGFLRHLRPKRLIEIGSGYSTLVTARVNQELLGGRMEVTCIEPHPRDFVRSIPGVTLRVERVQDVPISLFETLEAGDVLFIDSSHVVKTGGDAVWEYLELLPRLAPGVVVHIHDIFLPRDYPKKWVMEGWGWNEQYLVRAFLAFNSEYEVLWSTFLMFLRHRAALARGFPSISGPGNAPGSSFWIRRRNARGSRLRAQLGAGRRS